MPTIFICDDEPKILSDIADKVRAELPDAEISEFKSGGELLDKLLKTECETDGGVILLLDIDMPDISGLEIAEMLGRKPYQTQKLPLVVFVTSHDELVYDSLKFHPFGFIRKNYMDKELPRILSECVSELNSRTKHFCFHSNNSEIRLLIDDILYFESEGNYLKLFAKSGEYRLRETLSAVENSLFESGFVRIHKGFLINQAAVKILGSDTVELTSGETLPIGRSYADGAKTRLMRCMMTFYG